MTTTISTTTTSTTALTTESWAEGVDKYANVGAVYELMGDLWSFYQIPKVKVGDMVVSTSGGIGEEEESDRRSR